MFALDVQMTAADVMQSLIVHPCAQTTSAHACQTKSAVHEEMNRASQRSCIAERGVDDFLDGPSVNIAAWLDRHLFLQLQDANRSERLSALRKCLTSLYGQMRRTLRSRSVEREP